MRMKIIPNPEYTFGHVDSAARKIAGLAMRGPQGQYLHQVVDDEPIPQSTMADMFEGPVIWLPAHPLRLACALLSWIRWGVIRRCLRKLRKVLCSSVYLSETKKLPGMAGGPSDPSNCVTRN